jgi:MPBQ/MSBQ methyltransferase
VPDVRLIQHKTEAYWFYRFLSPLYDRWVNPLFWTPAMRTEALRLARLDSRGLRTLDVGAGTGFSTEGIVEHVDAANVTLLDQSPQQLSRARRKPALAACTIVEGVAERLPFPTDHFDRYVSCGSIEYWPEPQAAIAEAYRVVKPGGIGCVVGPLPPRRPLARRLADLWMLFPAEQDYRVWMEAAGFTDIEVSATAPDWHGRDGYGLSIAGRKPAPGASPAAGAAAGEPRESVREPMTVRRWARWVAGSAAGAAFIPVAIVASLLARRRRG